MMTLETTSTNEPSKTSTPEDWVDQHGDYLFHFALGQLRDASVAEDLVQETFLAGWKSRSRFTGRSSERTWLVGILRHKICDHLRETCRERAVRVDLTPSDPDAECSEPTLAWMHEVAADCQSPNRRLELAEFRANLEMAIGQLPPRMAQVFHLYQVEERPNWEVCERLNISPNNLWVLLHRARRQLRDQLGEWWSVQTDRPSSAHLVH